MSSPKLPVILTAEAREDYHDLMLYGRLTWGIDAAERDNAKIARILEDLVLFPRMGRRKDGVSGEVRTIGVGQRIIYFRIDQDAIRVLRMLHERMDATRHPNL
jgi:toxin ParE1/3/4